MTTQQRIDTITEELRALYLSDNDAPRLIAEMVEREFPKALDLASLEFLDQIEDLESEIEDLESEIRDLKSKIEDLESEIEDLKDARDDSEEG